MVEKYDVAAWRHYNTAETLKNAGEKDDASYHFGMVGETALKYALRASGCEAAWKAAGTDLRRTPMRGHLQDLGRLVQNTATEIQTFASGRLAQPIATNVLHPSFRSRFSGWHTNIRYADPRYTPVSLTDMNRFESDAEHLILELVI